MSELTVSYCYRNTASESLVNQAKEAQREMEANKADKNYKKPSLIYQIPDATHCGPVSILSDTWTDAEKQAAENQLLYQRAIGQGVAEPAQQKLVFRAIGVIAAIILSGLTGRVIADSRKETAVFRAIGATRLDMALVHVVYTLLFSLRIALFAVVLGGSLAVIMQVLYAEEQQSRRSWRSVLRILRSSSPLLACKTGIFRPFLEPFLWLD